MAKLMGFKQGVQSVTARWGMCGITSVFVCTRESMYARFCVLVFACVIRVFLGDVRRRTWRGTARRPRRQRT